MGKVILITGTSSGFGRLAAPSLASFGHRVFTTMLPVDPNAGEFTRRLNAVHDQQCTEFLTASGMGGLL